MRWTKRVLEVFAVVVSVMFFMRADVEPKVHAVIVLTDITGSEADGRQIGGILDALGDSLGVVKVIHQTGRTGDRSLILNTINSLRVDAADGLVFYYSGHGATDLGSEHHYFELDSGEELLRQDVREALQNRNCRLAVLMSDCCSGFRPLGSPQRGVGELQLDQLTGNVRHILLNFRGLVDLQSSTAPELAWADEHGGVFTTALAHVLRQSDLSGVDAWESLHAQLCRFTNRGYRQLRDEILRNPATTEGEKRLLLDQPDQTPVSFSPFPDYLTSDAVREGLRVVGVAPGTAATSIFYMGQEFQLDPGDLIVELGGVPLNSLQEFRNVIDRAGPGAEISITVEAHGERMRGKVRLDRGGQYRFGASVRQ